MSDKKVFVSDHPDVLAALVEFYKAEAEFKAKVDAFREEMGGRRLFSYPPDGFSSGHWFGVEVLGIDIIKEGGKSALKGWRYQARRDCWVPDKRTKAGRAYADRLKDELQQPSPFRFLKDFTPSSCSVGGRIYSPGIEEIDGKVYMTWSDKATFEGNEYFKPCKLSEFYAAKEAKETADG